jgi:hypothetical protein
MGKAKRVLLWRSLTRFGAVWAICGTLTVVAVAPTYARMLTRLRATERVDSATGIVYRIFDGRTQLKYERTITDGGVLFFLASGSTAFAVGAIFTYRIRRTDREKELPGSPAMDNPPEQP